MSNKKDILSYQPTAPLCEVSIDNTGYNLIEMYPLINRDNAHSILDKIGQIVSADTECAITVQRPGAPSNRWHSYFIDRDNFLPEEGFILAHYATQATLAIPQDHQEINPGLQTLVSIVRSDKMSLGAKHQAINAIAKLGMNSSSDPDRHYAGDQLFDLTMTENPPSITHHINQILSGKP